MFTTCNDLYIYEYRCPQKPEVSNVSRHEAKGGCEPFDAVSVNENG